MTVCMIVECVAGGKIRKGMCPKHYWRVKRNGSPYRIEMTPEEKFWSKVDKTDTCWEWIAGKTSDGYGVIKRNGIALRAHRVTYEAAKGRIPDGLLVDHICHNRACVNPDHMRLATQKQNLENQVSAMRTSKTGVRGVTYSRGRYVGSVRHFKKLHYVGYFTTMAEAEAAVIAKRNELFTHNDADRRTA